MAFIRVPPRHRPAFSQLARLPEPEFEALLGFVREIPPTLSLSQVAVDVLGIAPSLGGTNEDLIQALISLSHAARAHDWTPEQLAGQLKQASDLGLSQEEGSTLAGRVELLLASEGLSLLAKAVRVVADYERPFHDAKIFSDLRPVMPHDPSNRPIAMSLVHMLKIEFFEDGDLKQFVTALDRRDLLRLRDTVLRATIKDETLVSLIDSTGIPLIQPEED